MTDREAILEAIRQNPEGDVPCLIYADYLEEYGRTEVDAATVEFIRLSCKWVNSKVLIMPRDAYPWLEEHWVRLIPTLYDALNTDEAWWHRRGRWVHADVAPNDPAGLIFFEFWKGFLKRIQTHPGPLRDRIKVLSRQDQPLAELGDLIVSR